MFAPDPIEQYLRAAARARAQGIDTAPAALATADRSAAPSLRIILVRGVDVRGFVFYTNYRSRKARELTENPQAALCQHWDTIEEQIRVEGRVELVDPVESDAYFKGRPRDSQIGAWASLQSQTLPARGDLDARIAQFERQFSDQPVPRPPHWGGYRVMPDLIEIWYGQRARLHERERYERANGEWTKRLLYP